MVKEAEKGGGSFGIGQVDDTKTTMGKFALCRRRKKIRGGEDPVSFKSPVSWEGTGKKSGGERRLKGEGA